jgi:hypothetical protein
MGARLRLKATRNLSGFTPEVSENFQNRSVLLTSAQISCQAPLAEKRKRGGCVYIQCVQPTWTFTRDGKYLVLQRDEDADGHSLRIVSEDRVRTVSFHEVSALIIFQTDMEALLVRTGWSLESFAPERRHDHERRMFPRENPDRRRWWTDGRARSTDDDLRDVRPSDRSRSHERRHRRAPLR